MVTYNPRETHKSASNDFKEYFYVKAIKFLQKCKP